MAPTPNKRGHDRKRVFEEVEYDRYGRPWIQAVKLVPEYNEHWSSLWTQYGAKRCTPAVEDAHRAWDPEPLGDPDECRRAFRWLAIGWRLPAGPVDPDEFDDLGASVTTAILRAARRMIPAVRPVQEVAFDDLVRMFQSVCESADYSVKLHGGDRKMLFEIIASELKHRIGAEPAWPIPPVVRLDVDLLQPNSEITQHLDALRKLHQVRSQKRPRRSEGGTEDLLLGFRLLHARLHEPRSTWKDLYRAHLSGAYDDETLARTGRSLRRRARAWIDSVRREVLGDPAASPRSHYAQTVVKVDGEYRVQTVWREPVRVKGGFTWQTKRVIR